MTDAFAAATAAAAEQAGAHTVAPPVVPGRVLDVDGDMICYWAGGSEDTPTSVSRQRALDKIEAMREMSGAEKVVVHLTADSSTKGDRRIIATVKPYQGQRNSGRKPRNWGYLRDYFSTAVSGLFEAKVWATREADDGICYAAHSKPLGPGQIPNRVIASADKDMRMIPGWHLDWNTFELVEIPAGTFEKWNADHSKLFGTRWFWMQMLHGDTADNIPGLPRLDGKPVGPVRAEKLLSSAICDDSAYVMVSNSYAFEYGDEWQDRFVEQAMLLWMRTDPGAHHHNFMCVIPEAFRAELWPAVHKVTQRIKDAYAEAQKLGGLGVQEDRA